jgi:lysophospholipase L1-like esterase
MLKKSLNGEFTAEETAGLIAPNIPDLVLLHIGTNDIAFTPNDNDPAAGVKEIIKTLRAKNAEVVILLAKIIPIEGAKLEYKDDVATYNTSLQALADADKHPTSKLTLVDHFTPFSAGTDLYVGDGVHPNAAGDEVIATEWFTEIEKLFQ